MFKSIIKEIGISLLLLVAIVLILIIILYDYSPSHKTIPSQLAEYQLPADVEKELSESVTTEQPNIVKTYKIEEEDLSSYEKTDEYDRGKINPFKFSGTNAVAGVNQTTGIINNIGK